MTPEGRVKAKVKRAFQRHFNGAYVFMPVQNGMGAPGLDFYCCVYGMFVAVETKAAGGSLTERQQITAAAITKAGGLVFKVDDDASLARCIGTIQSLQITRNVKKLAS